MKFYHSTGQFLIQIGLFALNSKYSELKIFFAQND